MTRAAQRWKIVGLVSGTFVAALVALAFVASHWYHATERTYYGPHTDLLRVGERITVMSPDHSVASRQDGVVQGESAWDEDSCDPDRPIKIALTSGEARTVPRHLLRRE